MTSTAHLAEELIYNASYNGGGTVSLIDHEVPDFGYIVGGRGEVLNVFGDSSLSNYDVRLWLMLAPEGTFYAGSWADDGMLYFDFCDHMLTLADAMALAKSRDEKAIFDIKANDSIYL